MTVRLMHRPARVTTPLAAPDERALTSPPPLGDAPVGGLPLQSMLPLLGSVSSITMMVVLRSNPVMLVVGGMVLVVALVGGVGMALGQRGTAIRQRKRSRERYLDYLEQVRSEFRAARERVRVAALTLDPAPSSLAEVVRSPERLWERRRSDADFLRLRAGIGARPWFALAVPEDPNPVQPFDPIMEGEARGVAGAYSEVPGMPLTAELNDLGQVAIVGPGEVARGLARALVAQLAAFHAPDDAQLAFAFAPERAAEWAGADLLPHTLSTTQWDGPAPVRRVAPSLVDLGVLLHDELAERAARATARQRAAAAMAETPLVVFADEAGATASTLPLPEGVNSAAQLGITVVHLVEDRLHEPSDVQLRLTVGEPDEASAASLRIDDLRDATRPAVIGIADRMPCRLFAGFAARVAPLRLSAASRAEDAEAHDVDALELFGVTQLSEIGPETWRARGPRDFLRVPVAVDDYGRPVHLDLKESAQAGMGPHGICIGATGSGKSEFLRSLVLSLALRHSPEDLAMILVDYKGGAAFNPFSGLPHVAGLVDNLADDAQLIQRAQASIAGEVVRRQQQLKDAGSMASITEYRKARESNPAMPPMPHLFLVIDEFGELLTAQPDFIDLLLTIGRIGRSIGVHMLLSSQRIEGGRLRGLDSYLSYRIGLRTFSEQESATILNTPDAFHLPAVPGFGYLKVDTSVYTRFRAAYVSGPLPGDAREQLESAGERAEVFTQPVYNTIQADAAADAPDEAVFSFRATTGPTLIDEAVSRLRRDAVPTTPVWLPPLPEKLPLFQVIDDPGRRPLEIPLGLIDDPAHQSQRTWEVDLTRNGGHFAVIGAPQTGRSTFLRTFVAGAASVYTPRQITMYGLDLTGSGLERLEDFPHVGGVSGRGDAEEQLRLLEQLGTMISQREQLFREHRIESLAQFRSLHAAGALPQVVSPDVVLVVDGYGLVRTDFEHLDEPLTDLVTRGGSYGLHVVLALTRWSELRMAQQPLIGNRFELRLNDPGDSIVGRKLAETIRSNQPGRVLTEAGLFAQVALPTMAEVDGELGEALTQLARQAAASWEGPGASPIRLLPLELDPTELPDAIDEPDQVPVGLRQDTMEPALLDFAGADQHVLVFGDARSGKSTLLRQIIAGLTERYTADELVFAIMEPRGDLHRSCPENYLGGHAGNAQRARELSAALALELGKRQNGEAAESPRIVVLVDDFDVLASGGAQPLEHLLPFLPSARDLKLNVVLTRPVAGASRSLYENTLMSLRDTGGSGVVLSGERSEGQLWPGIYASQTPPGRATFVRRGERPRLIQIADRRG